jgi:uncharacterized membrane protein
MSRTKDTDSNEGFRQLSRIVTVCLIVGIIIVSGFIIYYLLTPEPPYHQFFILNGERKAENYPSQATEGEEIYFYVGVRNYLEKDLTFNVKIFKGNDSTDLTKKEDINAELNQTIGNITIEHGEEWVSDKLTISFLETGNRTVIAQLYEVGDSEEEYLNIVYIRLNITNS